MPEGVRGPVLLTGATGFVGSRLFPRLKEAGLDVVCASRRPDRARDQHPDRTWVQLDVSRPQTLEAAMEGCRSALYLIHQISGDDYVETERRSARRFAEAAERAGLERIVYLGGVRPAGTPSKHLESRLETGRMLRQGPVSCVELRAAMIIGAGSASWQIVCDLASRLPAMLLPKWTRSRSQPVWIGDVVEAVLGALRLPDQQTGWYDIPGPDTLTVEDILGKTATLMGKSPWFVDVPFLTPKLSSYWLRFVTSCDYELARELVEGLKYDLLADDDGYWERIGHPDRCGFEEAARRELGRRDGN